MRVLVVDDSVVFRSQIKEALTGQSDIEVVGVAADGRIALDRLEQISPDLITLDYEMPNLNGLETIREMRRRGFKTKIILFTAHTEKGAKLGLEALRLGADDVVPKPTGASPILGSPAEVIRAELLPKVLQFLTSVPAVRQREHLPEKSAPEGASFPRVNVRRLKPKIIVIASSTGGPAALETVFKGLKGPLSCPILIVQHMPPIFTACLAQRLQEFSGLSVSEAKQFEVVKNQVYIAPGDFHMTIAQADGGLRIRLDQSPQVNSVRPAADNLFASVAETMGADCMSFVLTGMGQDGLEGAKKLKHRGAGLMIQNKTSCVVFGMPGAIHQMNLQDAEGDLSNIRDLIMQQTGATQ